MRSPTFKFFCLLLVCFTCLPAWSNEGGSEAKSEEAGGGGSGGGTAKELIEFNKKEARLNTLRTRIDEANKKFKKLVEEKDHVHDARTKQEIAESMAALAKERAEWTKELTELSQEVMYQYPNKGQPIEKHFSPEHRKEAEQEESATGLDAQLTETKRRIDKKYAPLIPKEVQEAEAAQKKPAETAKSETKKPKIRLEK